MDASVIIPQHPFDLRYKLLGIFTTTQLELNAVDNFFEQTTNTSQILCGGHKEVYITKSDSDLQHAINIKSELDALDYSVFLYQDERSHNWKEAIHNASTVIVILTNTTFDTEWVVNEITEAVKYGKKVSMNLSLNEDTMSKWMLILENVSTINLEVIQ